MRFVGKLSLFIVNIVHWNLFSWNTLFVTFSLSAVSLASEEASAGANEGEKESKPKDNYDYDNLDWGTFYDPKDIFCGEYDCYKVLGLDYYYYLGRNFTDDNLKVLTQKYRKMSRRWHPDKNKRPDAEERFVKIKRAYEVLSNYETRFEYDYFRDRPDAYFHKYGSSVLWSYAPKSNTAMVIVALLALTSWLTYLIQKQRWCNVADRLVKAAVEDWSLAQGGSESSIEIRKRALEILEEQEKEAEEKAAAAAAAEEPSKNGTSKSVKKKVRALEKKEKKKQEQEEVRKIVKKLVDEIDDFGHGFHKPTYKDLLVVKLGMLPYHVSMGVVWRFKYTMRRIRGLPYNDEELAYFTEQMVGSIAWGGATDEEKKEWISRKLWIMKNYEEWIEDQEIKKMGPAVQKKHAKMKKKNRVKGD